MIDYSKYNTASADPEAAPMIETLRAVGYSIQAAVADIIDNSISAGAKSVWVDFDWKGQSTWISIKDDGVGMDNKELIQAMRPGAKNPMEERKSNDLGRFGMGLKSASFSQCRRLTVISKRVDQNEVYWTWDLDYVKNTGRWELIDYVPPGFENALNDSQSGTIVIWNELDRLVKNLRENDRVSLNKILQVMESVKTHLAMVFHRFIEDRKVAIFFRGRAIDPWNPFYIDHSATQKFPEEPVQNNTVRLRGYVLPHKSKLSDNEFRALSGPEGWNEQQGFYIYRGQRLLVAGEWLGLFRKEEHYKLARIMIDLPNNIDADWQIDIKKSTARPPIVVRDQLKAYANIIRARAVEVYRHKGKVLQKKYGSTEFHQIWLEKIKGGKRYYVINREHPLIKPLLESETINSSDIRPLLKLVEETVPVPLITIKESEQPEMHGQPFEQDGQDDVKRLMNRMFENLIKEGKAPDRAKAIILNIEPFNLFPHFIDV